MSLTYRIIFRISFSLLILLSLWAWLFYMAMMDEVTDEVDDALELYAETLMTRSLAGKELPLADNGTNNSYFLREVDEEYARTHPRLSFSDETVYIEVKRETEPARVMKTIFLREDGTYGELTVMTPTIEKDDLYRAIACWVVGLFAVLMLVIIGVSAWVISRSMRPLYRLLGWLDRYNITEQPEPLDNPTRVTEFRKLNETIWNYSLRNRKLFEQQKRFIGNASHELQTPLAICQSRLEMLCNTELSEEQMGEIIKTLQTLEHLSELNRSLLFLSKIDNRQFPEVVAIDVYALLEQTVGEYRRLANKEQVDVHLHEAGRPVWMMNESLAKALVHNLLRNAIIHNTKGGRVDIAVDAEGFVMRNDGVATSLDADCIFDRFYKAGGKPDSTGLGLSIVDAIARLYNLDVSYQFEAGKHTFRVRE
ncbi:MAG: sensor histidine kinase [Bacteroidaceae bacterium]|nr:sensor histidine kinase [Bacteroidaceae bacterium]